MQGFFVYNNLQMHYLYIIYSESIDRYYVGESPDAINRLDQHNSHYFKGAFTKAAKDWKIMPILLWT